jgi:hypothetical protein
MGSTKSLNHLLHLGTTIFPYVSHREILVSCELLAVSEEKLRSKSALQKSILHPQRVRYIAILRKYCQDNAIVIPTLDTQAHAKQASEKVIACDKDHRAKIEEITKTGVEALPDILRCLYTKELQVESLERPDKRPRLMKISTGECLDNVVQ